MKFIKLHSKDGTPNAYAFRCGYVESPYMDIRIKASEGCGYLVTRHPEHRHGWKAEVFRTLKGARMAAVRFERDP